jgi:hypothetical protein
MFYVSVFRKDTCTLISADGKCKSLRKCVEIEQAEKIYEEI